MVLAELGKQINGALQNLTSKPKIDDNDLKEFLNEIARALLLADVNINVVKKLQQQVRTEVSLNDSPGLDKRRVVQQALMRAVHKMVDPGKTPFVPKKGVVNVVMFVGLQGGGKTTSCTKYAAYFQRQGFKTALVCADTYRAGAYDQLRQNALKAGVRFYGSITETDPVQIAKDGVAELRKERYDLIVVDTSGRNKQEAALFEEMKQVEAAIKPHDIVYVLDGTNGQAVHEQAAEFKAKVKVGSVIITKMDCQTKGGGALSAVATTGSPIIFIGTGEHFDDFDLFSAERFVSRMLGRGDIKTLFETLQNASPDFKETQQQAASHLAEGTFTMRDLQDVLGNFSKLGSMSKIMEMIPGMGQMAAGMGEQSNNVFKSFIHMMDSMTPRELDDPKITKTMTPSRIARIARGSGRHIGEVTNLLVTFSKFEELSKTMGGKNGLKALGGGGGLGGGGLGGLGGLGGPGGMMNNRNAQAMLGNMSKLFDPRVLKQMGGMGGIQQMMKQMAGMKL
jgi:signal recognition particle subunit SRP54